MAHRNRFVLSRRTVLAMTGTIPLLGWARSSEASSGDSKIQNIARDSLGTTFHLELDHAPFPAPGAGYQDRSVFIFVPSHYRATRPEHLDILIHFHGHSTTAERALLKHELREQLYDSKQNALLVVPQGPVMSPDSAAGKLETPGGLARLLYEVRDVLATASARSALGASAIATTASIGNVCISAHSGGYHSAACCVKHGGCDVSEVYLFDALYNEVETFRDWIVQSRNRGLRRKLISYYTDGTTEFLSRKLRADLELAGISCAYEKTEGTLSRGEFTLSQAVFVRTGLSHSGVTHELNALRDCLYGSVLKRRLRSSWFDRKSDARALERRR